MRSSREPKTVLTGMWLALAVYFVELVLPGCSYNPSTPSRNLKSPTSAARTWTETNAHCFDDSNFVLSSENEGSTWLSGRHLGLPRSFELNCGQADPLTKFLSRGAGYTLNLTPAEAVLTLTDVVKQRGAAALPHDGARRLLRDDDLAASGLAHRTETPVQSVLRTRFVGSNPNPVLEGLDQLTGKSNYLMGDDPKRWHTNIPQFASVKYRDVYPGVDLIYHSDREQLEYDVVLRPGATADVVRIAYEGANININETGDLVLRTAAHEIRQHKPLIYQEAEGIRSEVAGRFVLRDGRDVGFEVSDYDKTRPLVIDPILTYSTFFGGSGTENITDVAVDKSGSVYVVGSTDARFDNLKGIQKTLPEGLDSKGYIFVAKIGPPVSGSASLVYITYLVGDKLDQGSAIAVDSSGNACITGFTYSHNFPNPLGVDLSGHDDNAFVAKLNASGSDLDYFAYLGGTGTDSGADIALDAFGNIYVSGETDSGSVKDPKSFRTTSSAYKPEYNNGGMGKNAFVVKIDPTALGTDSLVYSTVLGGSLEDTGTGVAVDSHGQVYVIGITHGGFPTTDNAYQMCFQGTCNEDFPKCSNAFVAKLDPNASGKASLVYSTYLGGSGGDEAMRIAVDGGGNAYVAGMTSSANFPRTINPKRHLKGISDAFVVKINPLASGPASLVYSTLLGGKGNDVAVSVAVDCMSNAYVAGYTDSLDFPTESPVQKHNHSKVFNDAFVSKLNQAGSLVYSTYIGGSGDDKASSVALDGSGSAFVAGSTSSRDFPITPRSIQTVMTDSTEGFIIKIESEPPSCSTELQNSQRTGQAPMMLVSNKAGKNIKPGHSIAVPARNSDGAETKELIFARPLE